MDSQDNLKRKNLHSSNNDLSTENVTNIEKCIEIQDTSIEKSSDSSTNYFNSPVTPHYSSRNSQNESSSIYSSLSEKDRKSFERKPLHNFPCEGTPVQKNHSSREFSPKTSPPTKRRNSFHFSRENSIQRTDFLLKSNFSQTHKTGSSPYKRKKNESLSEPKLLGKSKNESFPKKKEKIQLSTIYKVVGLFFLVLVFLFFFITKMKEPFSKRELVLKKAQIEEEMLSLRVYFPKQSEFFWDALNALMEPILLEAEPSAPATFLFVAPPGTESTVNCFLKYFIKRLDKVTQAHHPESSFIDATKFQNEQVGVAKQRIDSKIRGGFEEGRMAVVVKHIETLKGKDVMIFHGFCDTINAPFKKAIYLLIYYTTTPVPHTSHYSSFRNLMASMWLADLGEDTFSSLMTRISNTVILVNTEPLVHCSSKKPV